MGLTGGLVDAGNLFDCLYGIATGQLDDSILDKYSEVRIQKYNDIINPISSSNIRRVWDPSPEAIKADPFFQMVERANKDEEFAEEMKKVSLIHRPCDQRYGEIICHLKLTIFRACLLSCMISHSTTSRL